MSVQDVERYFAHSNTEMVHWSFHNGRYDIRLRCVQLFASRSAEEDLPLLLEALDDPTEIISQTSIEALEQRTISKEITQRVLAKKDYWIEETAYRQSRRDRKHYKRSVLTEPKERGTKSTLETMRTMLKKPISGGKWF